MSVTLKQFVEQALLDITTAVDNAKRKSPVSIAPGFVEGQVQMSPQMVDFAIQVTVSEEKNKTGKGEASATIISVLKASTSGEVGSKNEEITTQSISFSVPIYFQGRNTVE